MSPLKQFLSQVEEALHKSLSEMEPYDETMQAGEDGIWYPSIEVE